MKKPVIMLAKGDVASLQGLTAQLMHYGLEVNEVSDTFDVLQTIQKKHADLILIGSANDDSQIELQIAERIRRVDNRVPLILITIHSSEEHAIAALKAGINDYFIAPVSKKELVASIERNLPDHFALSTATSEPSSDNFGIDQLLIGKSRSIQKIKDHVLKVAATDSNVLITGDTGTGKELVTELIHQCSPRRRRPLICVNCAVLPDNLLESELFGYEKGAFTGAQSSYSGKLKLAEGGTFFFDEIGEMNSYSQAKILRCLESREIFPLGGKTGVSLNIRVVAATNQNLEHLVTKNKFRKDLYFRLNVARIHLPPLKERKEDIPILINHYLQKMNQRCGRKVEGLCAEALTCLLHYDWPGNVRELKNLLEAIFISPPAGKITVSDLPESFPGRVRDGEEMELDERERLISTLAETNWNKSKAAQKLRWSRMTLYRKMKKYHIQ